MTGLSYSFLKRVPVFRNYLAANTVSLLGTSIFDIAMPLYVWERTHSPVWLAMVSVALTLPYFLMAPITGYAVDHFDNRKLMLFSDVGQVITLFALLTYEYLPFTAVWPILLTIFVCKTLAIFFETAGTFHMIPALVPEGELAEANTWFLSSQRFIQIIGPLTGGFLVGMFGFRVGILINLLSYGATLYFMYHMRDLARLIDHHHAEFADLSSAQERHRRHPPSFQAIYRSFAHSMRYIWHSPLFRPFVYAMFFWNVSSLVPNTPTITYYFRGFSEFTPQQYGLVTSLFGVTGIIGYFVSNALYNRYSFSKAFVGACLWQALLATFSVFFVRHPLMLALVFSFSRMGSSVYAMGAFFLRQTEVPRSMVGAVNSSIRMLFMSAAPLSSFLQGFLIKHFGVTPALVFGALALWGTFWFARQVASSYTPELKKTPVAA